MKHLSLVPFDLSHAKLTATFAKAAFEAKRKGIVVVDKRVVIPNDTKLLAQAQSVQADYFVARDGNASKVLAFLQGEELTTCQFLNISTSPQEFFNELFSI